MNALAAFQGRDLVIGHVGDSRAVLGTRDKDDSLISVQLTVDLKPNLPGLFLSLSIKFFSTTTFDSNLPGLFLSTTFCVVIHLKYLIYILDI